MVINRNNCEAYFIDYHEGRLPEKLAAELMLFLEANPDLKDAFDDFESVMLEPDNETVYRPKASLMRSEATGISLADEAAIARLEGDPGVDRVDGDDSAALHELYRKTKLQPDPGIVYPFPDSLKKRTALAVPVYVRFAAAAAILLLFSIGAWLIFSPAAIPERKTFSLAKLEKQEASLETSKHLLSHPGMREVQAIAPRMPAGGRVDLAALRSHPAGMMRNSGTTASYPAIMLPRQDETMAVGYQELASLESREDKTLAGKVIAGFFNKVKAPFRQENNRNKEVKGDGFSFWDLAELGVKGVNILGDHDYTLVRDYNEKGNVTGVVIVSE